MRAGVRALLLVLAAGVCASHAQTATNNNNNSNNDNKPQQRSVWDEPIRFTSKGKDACTMVVSGAGDYTRLRVSCKGPAQGQTPGRSYYCDFQGKPNLCRAYNTNPRHYFTQMMWDMRKLGHACQGGPKVYRPAMCKKYPEEAHMTFLAAWPKPAATLKPAKPAPAQDPASRKPAPAQPAKPAAPTAPKAAAGAAQPAKPQSQPAKPQPGKAGAAAPKKPTVKPGKPSPKPAENADGKATRLAQEYCWKSFHGICTYFIGWFQN